MTAQDIRSDSNSPPVAGDLFGEVQLSAALEASQTGAPSSIVPGLLVVGTASLAAAWMSQNYGVPIVLAGLLIGLALSFVSSEQRTHAGLKFASGPVLRIGIVLIGTQITFMQITALGIWPFVGILAIMGLTIGAALIASRLIGENSSFGLLCGGATAICGMSAALAIYGLIDKDKVSQTQFTITLVGITVASTSALLIYPVLAPSLGFDDYRTGFLLGASIHDVAQALAAGFSVSDEAGQTAAIVKLTRVALLAPLVSLFAIILASKARSNGAGGGRFQALKLPWFIVCFLAVVALNSFVSLPEQVAEFGGIAAKAALVLAVVSVAMTAQLKLLMGQNLRIFVPIMAATVTALLAALGVVALLP